MPDEDAVDLPAIAAVPAEEKAAARTSGVMWVRPLRVLMLVAAALLFGLHFVHLKADFPNHSPWVDWSKFTDEGWYGDAAIRQSLSGHWYWKGDFNPAVALPVWPVIEYVLFRFTGVSTVAARSLTLCIFGVTLLAFYILLQTYGQQERKSGEMSLAAPLAVLLLCASPFFFVFERMAILEPLLITLTALALLAASRLYTGALRSAGWREMLPSVLLMLLLPAMVLTKTTAICLYPAVLYMVWARAGYRFGAGLRMALPPILGGALLWCSYFFLLVRPHYLEDYQYLFSANAYPGIELAAVWKVVQDTVADGAFMGIPLYVAFFVVLAMGLLWRGRLLRNPLFTSLLVWVGGYFFFLAYHNNLQPRYYLVVAAPITVAVALGIDYVWRAAVERFRGWMRVLSAVVMVGVILGIVLPDAAMQIGFLLHPTYDFDTAAQGIKQIVLADKSHPHLVLSISGSDITLMTGLPSIDDDFGTLSLEDRIRQYRPGWYVAWNEIDDDKAEALTGQYRVVRAGDFPAYDDLDRNLLILYRLDPMDEPQPAAHLPQKRHVPKPLATKLGQQPTPTQLKH